MIISIALLLVACGGDEPTPVADDAANNAGDNTAQVQPQADTESDTSTGDNAADETQATVEPTATPIPEPTATPAPPTPTPDLTAGRMILWHSWAGADSDALAQMLVNFNKNYPNMTIDTLFVAHNDLLRTYAEAVQAGGGPDLVLAPNWWLVDLVGANVLLPLNEMMTLEMYPNYWDSALGNLDWGGQLYGLPTYFEVISLYYNKSLVTAEQLPGTTGELLALTQQDPTLGIGLYLSFYHLYWGIPAYGSQLVDETGVALDKTAGTAEFLNWLVEVNSVQDNYIDLDYGMILDRFTKGEFAFFVDGPWSLGELQGALGDDLGVTQLPAGPVGVARPWLNTDGVFLNPATSPAQQQRAFLLAQHITNAESGRLLAEIAGRLPANRNVDLEALTAQQPTKGAILQAFLAQADTAHAVPHGLEQSQILPYAGDMLIKVTNGVVSADVAVIETTALINDVLQDSANR
ncbi:MAG: extracellular solute-binding protein [Chloroflexota bacterium]